MFTILMEIWQHIESLKPAFISKHPHFNFITVHYFWIIGMALFGSICLYIRGGIKYIDALFLASGAATQSGLNTVDINKLDTWQQIVCYIVPILTNPITVNSFVVFLRLYWFEKRFQHIVQEASKARRSMSKSLSKSRTDERDIGQEERGVNGRSIVVMHHTTRPNGMSNDAALPGELDEHMEKANVSSQEEQAPSSSESSKGQSSESGVEDTMNPLDAFHRPQIKFADQVKRSDGMTDKHLRLPSQCSHEDHIAFLERQRKRDDGEILRIPGPRDADAGLAPKAVDQSEEVSQVLSRGTSTFNDNAMNLNGDDHNVESEPPRRNIIIAEPIRSGAARVSDHVADDTVAAKHVLGALRFRKPRIFKGQELHQGASNDSSSKVTRSNTFQSIRTALSREKEDVMPYLSWEPTVGRNSAFVDLTEEQREELGGIEYRSLKTLALILVLYFVGFSLFGLVCLTPWIVHSKTYGSIVQNDGQGRVWWGVFTANSAFTDLGYTLTPDSMISFQPAVWPLVLMTFLIIIGNTGFPIMLRIIIWVTSKYVPKESGIYQELRFLLEHPRRCFTLLFPDKATWWLFWILVILNGTDLILFIVLDLGNTIVTQLPVRIRVLDGWFQAVSTRTAGFGVVNLAELHPGIQVSYLIMMYISVLPIAISVRRTNVYEEKSLGIYGSPMEESEDVGEPSYVGAHLRRQLSFDLWYIFLGFFVIAIAEGTRLQSGDPAFTMFSVLFEIVSSYGTVGLSLGYTNINASFSAEFGVIAKLVIISMQIRGRHRGLPYELDRAILLPSEHLQEKEADDNTTRMRRRSSAGTIDRDFSLEPSATATGRNRSREPKAQNLLGTLLHPGPTIPISHRVDQYRRRHSIATTARSARSLSPGTKHGATTASAGKTEDNRGRTEGRRSFFQEGVNSPPADADA